MALAFLPAHLIEDAYNYLVNDCRHLHGKYFDKFIKYFDEEWMLMVKLEGFSIYRLEFSTNNFLEAYHCAISDIFG